MVEVFLLTTETFISKKKKKLVHEFEFVRVDLGESRDRMSRSHFDNLFGSQMGLVSK